jgi:predicted lipoprotein with Yx(FWY)xxD motif
MAVSLALIMLTGLVAFAQDMTPPVSLMQHPTHGTILADSRGYTLYLWTQDTPGNGMSACAGNCLISWPPLIVDEATAMGMMPGMSMDQMMVPSMHGLGIIQRDDGSYQATYNGWPLYLGGAGGPAPGAANGQGAGGGTWWVVVVEPMMEAM